MKRKISKKMNNKFIAYSEYRDLVSKVDAVDLFQDALKTTQNIVIVNANIKTGKGSKEKSYYLISTADETALDTSIVEAVNKLYRGKPKRYLSIREDKTSNQHMVIGISLKYANEFVRILKETQPQVSSDSASRRSSISPVQITPATAPQADDVAFTNMFFKYRKQEFDSKLAPLLGGIQSMPYNQFMIALLTPLRKPDGKLELDVEGALKALGLDEVANNLYFDNPIQKAKELREAVDFNKINAQLNALPGEKTQDLATWQNIHAQKVAALQPAQPRYQGNYPNLLQTMGGSPINLNIQMPGISPAPVDSPAPVQSTPSPEASVTPPTPAFNPGFAPSAPPLTDSVMLPSLSTTNTTLARYFQGFETSNGAKGELVLSHADQTVMQSLAIVLGFNKVTSNRNPGNPKHVGKSYYQGNVTYKIFLTDQDKRLLSQAGKAYPADSIHENRQNIEAIVQDKVNEKQIAKTPLTEAITCIMSFKFAENKGVCGYIATKEGWKQTQIFTPFTDAVALYNASSVARTASTATPSKPVSPANVRSNGNGTLPSH